MAEKLSNVRQHTVYKVNGKRVPGVTTILGVLAKPALVKWANNLGLEGIDSNKYVDKLARIGTLAHYRIECELRGDEPDLDPYSPEEVEKSDNALLSWWAWREQHTIDPLLIEEPMVSEEYRYGGTMDCVGDVDNVPTLIDLKTSKGVYPEHVMQAAAYVHLLAENGYAVERVLILQIGRDESEGFSEHAYGISDLANHWRIFVLCREIYDLKKVVK